MSDKPILFSGPMVRALIAGRKTQTRRTLSGLGDQPIVEYDGMFMWKEGIRWGAVTNPTFPPGVRCKVGDRLYVREHWRTDLLLDALPPRSITGGGTNVQYIADGAVRGSLKTWIGGGKDRRAMHMPRWASRLSLLVTDVRVERLQDITRADAIAEGIEPYGGIDADCSGWRDYSDPSLRHWVPPYTSYATLWEKINGPTSWTDNPWVVAYSFEVIKQNIDQIGSAA